MHTVGSFQVPIHPQAPSPAGQPQFIPGAQPTEIEPSIGSAVVWPATGVSAAWRKLLLQADMAAPHVQVASIEGEKRGRQANAGPVPAEPFSFCGFGFSPP